MAGGFGRLGGSPGRVGFSIARRTGNLHRSTHSVKCRVVKSLIPVDDAPKTPYNTTSGNFPDTNGVKSPDTREVRGEEEAPQAEALREVIALLAVALWFTTPSYGIDSIDCRMEDQALLQNVSLVRLYRANCGVGASWSLVREKTTATAHNESLEVDTTGCVAYAVTTINAAGLETPLPCAAMISFPRAVSVEPDPFLKREVFDLAGRRVREPLRKGVYFERRGDRKRVIVVR